MRLRKEHLLLFAASLCWSSGCDRGSSAPPVVHAAPTLSERFQSLRSELSIVSSDGLTTAVSIEGSPANFERLRAALEEIVQTDLEGISSESPRRARIVMLGSSHVASDLVSGLLRDRLQRHFGDAGHGYVSALPPYDDYWQWGAQVEEGEGWAVVEASPKFVESEAFGVNGMAFDAFEPAWAELSSEHASSLSLLFLRQPGGGPLTVSIDGIAHPLASDASTWAAAVEPFVVPDGPHRVRIETTESAPVRICGVAFERDVAGVVVDQLGLNAATASHLLQNDEETQRVFLSSRDADLFVVWLGNNEATESRSIEEQTERFRGTLERMSAAMPGAGCLVLGPLDRRQHDLEHHPFVPSGLLPIAAMHREVALEQGCAFYDALAWQGGEGAVERFEAAVPPLVRSDRVHLTHDGYLRFANDFTRSLLDALDPAAGP